MYTFGVFSLNPQAAAKAKPLTSDLSGGPETLPCYICIESLPAVHFSRLTCSPVLKCSWIYVSILSAARFFPSRFFLCGNPPLHLWPLMSSSLFPATTLAQCVYILLLSHIFASVHSFCSQSRLQVQVWLRARRPFRSLIAQHIFLIVNGLIILPTQDTLWLLVFEGS